MHLIGGRCVIACADNRCFLIGGGSAETFFVSENATVGSVIGIHNKVFQNAGTLLKTVFLLVFLYLTKKKKIVSRWAKQKHSRCPPQQKMRTHTTRNRCFTDCGRSECRWRYHHAPRGQQ